MTDTSLRDAMFDTYIYETSKQLEQLEQIIMKQESENCYDGDAINEIFRIMHTIKGASGMMSFQYVADLAHSLEDLFSLLRSRSDLSVDYDKVSDLVLEALDSMKTEVQSLSENHEAGAEEVNDLIKRIRSYIDELEEETYNYQATIFFDECQQMEDLRAYEVVNRLKSSVNNLQFEPDINKVEPENAGIIREKGFKLHFTCKLTEQEVYDLLKKMLFVKAVKLISKEKGADAPAKSLEKKEELKKVQPDALQNESKVLAAPQSFTSISFMKLDKIMNLLGEMVVAEAMVLENPDLAGLNLEHFSKASRHLSKITRELQDEIISLRLVPVATVFQKMQRVVREMNKKLSKKVNLQVMGEETEIDKKVVDFITDPIMHMVRNAIDHGIECPEERLKLGKLEEGLVTLEAKNDGGEVFIKIKDDGSGLDKEKILAKAKKNGLIGEGYMPSSDEDIYKLIFNPGFSTKENASEFSGRGVGMDVVTKNIEAIGGSIHIETEKNAGTIFSIKIPLTMAIIDGMTLKVGDSFYTIPTRLIKESFRPVSQEIIKKPNGGEWIILRGECLPVVRLYKRYAIETKVTRFSDGIVVRLEQNGRSICLFVDEIVGQQQVVIKSLPKYILNMKKIKGISGCTLLGDGSISLLLEFEGLLN